MDQKMHFSDCRIDPLESRRMMAAVNATIDFGQTHQTIDGLGAALVNWLSPQQLPELAQASFYDQLVNDFGASAIRGAIHQNFELANDNNDPNTFNWAGFDTAPLGNTLSAFKRMHERGVRTFLLSVWSPPYWQKTNLSTAGGGFLRPEMRAEFAEWVAAAVIVAKRDYDIDISAVSVQNEQFFHEWYESSLMDNVMLRETVLAVQKKFKAENIKTKILANEDLGVNDPHRWKWFNEPLLADPQVDRNQLVIGSHFTGIGAMSAQGDQLAGTNVPLWYTEVSGKSRSWQDGVATAVEISEAITRANAAGYFYWQYTNLSATQWDITSSFVNSGVPNGKYYAAKHLYKYIRPGMQRVTGLVADANTSLGAYRHPQTGAATITLINNGLASNDYTLNLSNYAPGTVFRAWQSTETAKWVPLSNLAASGSMTITLPARSLVTLDSGADLPVQSGQGTFVSPDWALRDAVQQSRLRRSAMMGDLAGVQAALAAGENVNSADPTTGWTALHAAAASPFYSSDTIVNLLIGAGASVNAVASNGFTPLHAVAANGWNRWEGNINNLLARTNAKINAIIDAGANVNARDTLGRTPLHWGAAVPLMYSEYTYYTSVSQTLLSRSADKTLLDNAGKSAYDFATADYRDAVEQYFALLGGVANSTAPVARYVAYNADANAIDITTSENTTASFVAGDIAIINSDTNAPVTNWALADVFNYGITIGKVSFAARLPDGRYRMTIAAGALADQRNLATTQAIVLNFTVLRGDATGDGTVNFDDLLVVSQNYGKSNRLWSQGDFNGDGVVNFDDLLVLSQRYGTSLYVPGFTFRRR